MRTFEPFERFKEALAGERKYQVTGSITIVLRWKLNPGEWETLREMITEIDRQFPWRDDMDKDSDDSLGLFELTPCEEIEMEDNTGLHLLVLVYAEASQYAKGAGLRLRKISGQDRPRAYQKARPQDQ